MTLPLRPIAQAAALAALLAFGAAQADTGKLVLTGGVSSITGSAGGGKTHLMKCAALLAADLLLLCNPHNPGGTVFTREELLAIDAIAERHNLVICSDEIHCDLLPIPSQEAREGGISRECIEKEIIPLIRQVAKSTKSRVIDLNKVMKDKGALLVDGVHPNAEGHALMAEHILLVLKGKAAE